MPLSAGFVRMKSAIKSWLLSSYSVPILYSRDKLEYITDEVVQSIWDSRSWSKQALN